jgi:hypothetical protein
MLCLCLLLLFRKMCHDGWILEGRCIIHVTARVRAGSTMGFSRSVSVRNTARSSSAATSSRHSTNKILGKKGPPFYQLDITSLNR